MNKINNISISELTSLENYKFQKSTNIKIMYLNARSLKNKMDELEVVTHDHEIDVLVVTETWMKKEEEIFYNLTNFEAVYCSRNKRGGGTAIFVRKHIPMHVIYMDPSEFSFLTVKIRQIVIAVVYRSPKSENTTF